MKLEDQVCSLELSKKLKELGVKQESLFYRHPLLVDATPIYCSQGAPLIATDPQVPYYSAFTVAELGELLPKSNFVSGKDFSGHYFCRTPLDENNDLIICPKNTGANTRAEMLIHLIKNGIMEINV